jgi:hypothetical protein
MQGFMNSMHDIPRSWSVFQKVIMQYDIIVRIICTPKILNISRMKQAKSQESLGKYLIWSF